MVILKRNLVEGWTAITAKMIRRKTLSDEVQTKEIGVICKLMLKAEDES